MKLFKTKIWIWSDIVLLKWSVLLLGMVVGAYFADFIKQYILVFLLAAIILAIKPTFSYFKDEN
jgi:hypothetical protein